MWDFGSKYIHFVCLQFGTKGAVSRLRLMKLGKWNREGGGLSVECTVSERLTPDQLALPYTLNTLHPKHLTP